MNIESTHIPQEFTAEYRSGNMIFQLPHGVEAHSMLLDDDIPSQVIITPKGRELAKGKNRQKIFRELSHLDRHLPYLPERGDAVESRHTLIHDDPYSISDTSFWPDRLHHYVHFLKNPRNTIIGLEKKYILNERTRLLGTETLELFQTIQPFVSSTGFQLIDLYGATNSSIFMPYIQGYNLYDYRHLSHRIHQNPLTKHDTFHDMFTLFKQELIQHLKPAIRSGITVFLNRYGFEKTDLTPYSYTNGEKTLFAAVDVADETIRNPYLNFMLPQSEISHVYEAIESGNPQYASEQLKQSAIMVDPVIISLLDGGIFDF